MKNRFFIQVYTFIIIVCFLSCSKEISMAAQREGQYICRSEYYRYCRSCMPQDTHFIYLDTVLISFHGDSLKIDNENSLSKINNDSFVYDRGPGYPGIYYDVNFLGTDSFKHYYFQFIQAENITIYSYCKRIK